MAGRECGVDEVDEADEGNEHARDVDGQRQTFGRAAGRRVEDVVAFDGHLDEGRAPRLRLGGLGHHELGNEDGRGGAHERRGHEVSRLGAEGRVDDHDAAGNGRHEGDHDDEKLGAGHLLQVAADGGDGLYAEEDLQGGGEGLGAGGLEGVAHGHGDGVDDGLDNAEVVEDRREGGDKDDHRQHLEGHEGVDAAIDRKVAEDELRPFERGRPEDVHTLVNERVKALAEPRVEHQDADGELKPEPPGHDSPRHLPPVLGEAPGEQQDARQPQQTYQPQHNAPALIRFDVRSSKFDVRGVWNLEGRTVPKVPGLPV
jgi:hypothetical protein